MEVILNMVKVVLIILAVFCFLYIAVMLYVGRILAYNRFFRNKKQSLIAPKECNCENIEFKSPDGITLRGWFIKSNDNPSNRTLILIPGWRRTRTRLFPHIRLFAKSGFHILTYDQRSNGESDTAIMTYGPGEGRDLIGAIDYLKTRADVNLEKLGAVGFSLGSGGIIYAESMSDKKLFNAIVIEGTFADSYHVGEFMLVSRLGNFWGRLIGIAFFSVGTKIWTLGKFRHSRPADYVSKIPPTPLMIIRGENDYMIPKHSAEELIKAAEEPKEVWINPKGNHTRSIVTYPKEYKERVLTFLNKYL